MSFISCSICVIFLNMLQYALIFESILSAFTIIYITFLFSLGPLSLSPHLLFLPSVSSSPSPKCISSLSHFISLFFLSLSLYSTSLPPSPTKLKPEHQATPRHVTRTRSTLSDCRPPTQPHNPTKLRPEHQATSRHATRTRSTLSDRRPSTQPHKLDPPHPQQPMA